MVKYKRNEIQQHNIEKYQQISKRKQVRNKNYLYQ